MAAAYCYEGIPLRFLASLFDRCASYRVYEISMVGCHLDSEQSADPSSKICK